MAAKRPIVVEGNTPGKPSNKRQIEGKSRRSLFDENKEESRDVKNVPFATKPENWTRNETSSLVQYICLYWKDAWKNKWPMTKDQEFWDSCAKAANNVSGFQRTGLFTLLTSFLWSEIANWTKANKAMFHIFF
jgi:hypothetical protein